MKPVLLILRYFATLSKPTQVMFWFGLSLLPVVFISGMFSPQLAFGFALWSFSFLLAVPAVGAPVALRNLLSNRRLMLMPGFAGTAVVALFILAVLTAAFVPFFAWFYAIWRFPDSAFVYGFMLLSVYLPVTFMLSGRQWGVQAMGILLAPLIVVGTTALREAVVLPALETGTQIVVAGMVLLGWLAAFRLASRIRHVRPANVCGLRQDQQLLARIGTRIGLALWPGVVTTGSPALSLMMGYPATSFSVLRLNLLAGIAGPLPLVLIMLIADFNSVQISWLQILQILMMVYLFSAAVVGFQNAELVTRLRLVWLKTPRLRVELWKMLDAQHLLSQITFLLLASMLALAASLLATFRPVLALHYALLLLALNAHTSYFSILSKLRGWGAWPGLIALVLCVILSVWFFGRAFYLNAITPILPVFEAVLLVLALLWRQLGRVRFARIDWQLLKPLNAQRGMTS